MDRPDVIIERCSNYYEMNSSYSWSGEIAVLLDYIKELENSLKSYDDLLEKNEKLLEDNIYR